MTRTPYALWQWSWLAAVLGGIMLAASASRELCVSLESGWYCSLVQGELHIGSYQSQPRVFGLADFSVSRQWREFASLAWRPYRIDDGARSGVALPLWLPTLLAAGLAAYSHGYLAGLRRRAGHLCPCCNYDLSSLRIGRSTEEPLACPECGRRDLPARRAA